VVYEGAPYTLKQLQEDTLKNFVQESSASLLLTLMLSKKAVVKKTGEEEEKEKEESDVNFLEKDIVVHEEF